MPRRRRRCVVVLDGGISGGNAGSEGFLLVAVILRLVFTTFCVSVERLNLSRRVCRHFGVRIMPRRGSGCQPCQRGLNRPHPWQQKQTSCATGNTSGSTWCTVSQHTSGSTRKTAARTGCIKASPNCATRRKLTGDVRSINTNPKTCAASNPPGFSGHKRLFNQRENQTSRLHLLTCFEDANSSVNGFTPPGAPCLKTWRDQATKVRTTTDVCSVSTTPNQCTT